MKNVSNVNDVAKQLLDFSMIVQKIEVNNEIEGKILISSSKSLNSALIKMIKEMKEKENFDELQNEIDQNKALLDEQYANIDGYEQKIKDMKDSSHKMKKQIEEHQENIKLLTDESSQLSEQDKSLEKQLKELESKNEQLSTTKNNYTTKINQIQTKISELSLSQTKMIEEIESYKIKNNELEQDNKNKEAKQVELDSEHKIIFEKFNKLNNVKEKLEKEVLDKLNVLDSKLSQNDQLLASYNLQLDLIVQKELELEKVKKQNEEYSKKLKQIENDLIQSQNQFDHECDLQSKFKEKLKNEYNQLSLITQSTNKMKKDTYCMRDILKEFRSIIAKSKDMVKSLVKIKKSSKYEKSQRSIQKKQFENNFSDNEDKNFDNLSHSDSFSEEIIEKQYQSLIPSDSPNPENMQKHSHRLTLNNQNLKFNNSNSDFEDNISNTSKTYNLNKIDKELQKLSYELSKSKQTLLLLEKDNKMLTKLKESMKKDISSINKKIEENKVLNKFLLENNDSKEDLFDKILEQIKTLRELKIEEKIKNERVKTNITEFLTQEKCDKSEMIKDVESLETFLDDVKNQIQKLHVPNIVKLVNKNIDLNALQHHNEQLSDMEHHLVNQQHNMQNRSMMRMKRSSQYNSTGNLVKFKDDSMNSQNIYNKAPNQQ